MTRKKCPKCLEEKTSDHFHKCKKNKDGLQSYCKSCLSVANKLWAEENKVRFKDYSKKFSETQKRKAYLKDYREANKVALSERSRVYRLKNKERIKDSNKLYRENNREKCRESQRQYVCNNKEGVLISSSKYRRKNRDKYARYSSLRRSRAREAQPYWLSEEDILRMDHFWKFRELKSFVTGVEYEVDHIVPLRGKTVCGLHVPWNLRVITKDINRKKGARSWPNMWEEKELSLV